MFLLRITMHVVGSPKGTYLGSLSFHLEITALKIEMNFFI